MTGIYPSTNHKRFQIVSYRPFRAESKNVGESDDQSYAIKRAKEWAERYLEWGMTAFVRVFDSKAFEKREEEMIAVFASINGEVVEVQRQTRDNVLATLEEHHRASIEGDTPNRSD
jgi:hypothetical protein